MSLCVDSMHEYPLWSCASDIDVTDQHTQHLLCTLTQPPQRHVMQHCLMTGRHMGEEFCVVSFLINDMLTLSDPDAGLC